MNIKSLSHAALFCAASAIPFQALQAQAPAQPDDEDVDPEAMLEAIEAAVDAETADTAELVMDA